MLGNAHVCVGGAYDVPNARIDSRAVYTTSVPGGAFRGFGGPQGAFVAETQMNKLAVELGIDPVEIRRINTLRDGMPGITQAILPEGVSLPQVIDRCADEATMAGDLFPAKPFAPIASLPSEPIDDQAGERICGRLQERRVQLRVPRTMRCGDPAARRCRR